SSGGRRCACLVPGLGLVEGICMSRHRRTALLAAVVSCMGFAAHDARGQANITWGNVAGGTYNVGANWLGGVVPGATDTAIFNQNLVYGVFFNNSPTNANATLGPGTITFGSLGIPRTWTITNNFTQNSGAATFSATLANVGGNLSLSGGSQLTIPGGSDISVNTGTIGNSTDATLTIRDVGSTFQTTGAGTFFVGRSGGGGT